MHRILSEAEIVEFIQKDHTKHIQIESESNVPIICQTMGQTKLFHSLKLKWKNSFQEREREEIGSIMKNDRVLKIQYL